MTLRYLRRLPGAFPLKKAHPSDSGYDLWIVKKNKEENGILTYDTGIVVEPPEGYATFLVGRSSLAAKGYQLANCLGVIDNGYRGTLQIQLVKLRSDVEELELPAKIAQLVVHSVPVLSLEETEELTETERGTGGFGSSGH